MYQDSVRDRTLARDGTLIVSDHHFARLIVNNSEEQKMHKVPRSEDSDLYEYTYQESISVEEVDDEPDTQSHAHTSDDLDTLISHIVSSDRYRDEYADRVEEELDFFIRSDNILFLNKVYALIQEFKENGIVWGVGRGSSCSSYILYVLYVNDVNPIEFDIPFHEMSKEYKNKWSE